jgi:hypothetical protein
VSDDRLARAELAHDRTRELVMGIAQGDSTTRSAAVAGDVVLVRYRPGIIGETARTVHVVTLPPAGMRKWSVPGVARC